MSEAVRQLTPVEVVRTELFKYYEKRGIILNKEVSEELEEIFAYCLNYQSEYLSDRFKVADMHVQEYKEENMHLKTQLRILSKYIEGHNI